MTMWGVGLQRSLHRELVDAKVLQRDGEPLLFASSLDSSRID